jgi:hypothetical protein
MQGMVVVFLVLGVVETVQEMAPATSGESLGFRVGFGIVPAVGDMFGLAGLILMVGGVYYVTARKNGVTFREAIFNWPLVALAGIATFLNFL